MSATAILAGAILIASFISLIRVLLSNLRDYTEVIRLPRIKFKEFKESFVWVDWRLEATMVEYRGRYQWELFTFGYWDLLRYKIWKGWCETKVAVEIRREEEKFKLQRLREEIEKKQEKQREGLILPLGKKAVDKSCRGGGFYERA